MPDWRTADQSQTDQGQLEENRLLIAAQNGDSEAFGSLYELYAPAVFRYLYAHISERLDAEDLTEDVFFRVWRSLPQYRDQGLPFGAYIFRIARNALIDYYRRNRRNEPEVELEEETARDGQGDPLEATLQAFEHKSLREQLLHLREDYRTVIILRFFNDLSPDETAEIMGKSAGAVRVLQHRALAALRKLIGT